MSLSMQHQKQAQPSRNPLEPTASSGAFRDSHELCTFIQRNLNNALDVNGVPFDPEEPNLARALFFPWIDGIPERLMIENIDQFIATEVTSNRIPIMANKVNLNMDNIVHLAVSGSSGSGKSKFTEYLIRCLNADSATHLLLVDPKLSQIYKLGRELNLEVLSPTFGSNLNSFITEVNELLGRVINKIYERQQKLLLNPSTQFSKIYVVIDELLALVQGSSKQARDTFSQLLGTIALLGRETQVSLILISQRFDATAFGGNTAVREQINCAIILGDINTNTTQFLLPHANIEHIVVPAGIGTGIIKFTDDQHNNHIMPLLTPTYR